MEQEFHEDQEDGHAGTFHDGAVHTALIDLCPEVLCQDNLCEDNLCENMTGKQAPEWVEILPKAPNVKARDGREWHYNPQRILKAFEGNKGPLVIDYEHGQHHRAQKGLEAPASGWIEELAERDGAIWGRVKWTEVAAKKIIAREYRYLSPEFRHSKKGEILQLAGAGLVNRPALVMTALSSQQPLDPPLTTDVEKDMDLTAIASALSLSKDVRLDEILAAVAAREKERVELNAQLTEARDQLSLLQAEQKNDAIERLLDKAIEEGKILPAAREEYRALCSLEGGMEHFRSLLEKLPTLASTSPLERSFLRQEQNLAPEDVAVAARHYQQEQAQKGHFITISQAVDTVCEQKERQL
ncbi:phage protease [Bartonella machadoae]|uniref:phage protease n=1 Tax=Bartonella machadoae TaxID=2893471 RepID=UPI001F4CE2A5|nr:phage protease [Bartonella machadoae]UNE55512.1 phage protease [Bartonella machadoae]UNE55536.1 phage protease [Bartonella machadoae]UNE55611.1 phage protease [Bartonella machadoae]